MRSRHPEPKVKDLGILSESELDLKENFYRSTP